ncbi:MAG: glycosyltransferase [Muribaculaceae bacterium]|nr:glycosyltransferase [Muribaculaceae bacterium]
MTNPQISVIIPAYNAADTIDRAIKSIIAQSFGDWELIVVDDCSTDDTAGIVGKFSRMDPRIHLCVRASNSGGAFVPRIQGFRMACGQMIAPIDADDTVGPGYLEALMARSRSVEADMVLAAVELVSADGECRPYLPADGIDADKIYSGRDLVKETIEQWRVSGLGLIRRELALKVADMISSTGHPFADEVFTRQLLFEAETVALCNDAVYFYAMNPKSVTHRTDNHTYFQRFDLSHDLLEWCEENYSCDSVEYALFHKQNVLVIVAAIRDRFFLSMTVYREVVRRNMARVDMDVARRLLPAKYYYPLLMFKWMAFC